MGDFLIVIIAIFGLYLLRLFIASFMRVVLESHLHFLSSHSLVSLLPSSFVCILHYQNYQQPLVYKFNVSYVIDLLAP